MGKSLKKFETKKIKYTEKIKGGTDVETNGTDLAKAKNRRVSFIFL